MTSPDEDGLQVKMIIQADLLQQMVDALEALVHEFRIQWYEDLIRIWMIDPANVGSIYMDIIPKKRDRIQHYSVQDGVVQGYELAKLDDLLGYADADTLIQFEAGAKHNFRMNVTFPGVDVHLGGIDPDTIRESQDRPDLDLPAHYILSGSDIQDAVELNDMFSDHTYITVGDGRVEFRAEGDTDEGTYSREESEDQVEFIDHPDESVESVFSLDYLSDMAKVLSDYGEVDVRSGDESPIILETDLFEYMLAPRLVKD